MTPTHHQWRIFELSRVTLGEQEIHVWRASLQQPQHIIQELQTILSANEAEKARRFYFEKDRRSSIVAHGILRILLSQYLNVKTEQIYFCQNEYGKPALDPIHHGNTVNFNLSHSHELALYAFASKCEVGVDVEYMRTNIEYDEVARHSFSAAERRMLQELPAEAKREGFFNCWTRKEAYIKARGMGLSLPLDLFDVSLKPGEDAALLHSREAPQETERWTLQALDPGPGYAGAIVVEGKGKEISCWQYT